MMNNPIEIAMDKAKLPVDRIADILDVKRQTVYNYIKNPGQIPAEKIFKLASATGISVDKLYGSAQKQAGPLVRATYSESANQLKEYLDLARETSKDLSGIRIDEGLSLCRDARDSAVSELNDVINITKVKGRKPTICAFGPSDAGKSTLLNYLMGEEVVPAGYSPMTTVPTYIMHESERPDYLDDPVDNTIVFGRKKIDKRRGALRLSDIAKHIENPEGSSRLSHSQLLNDYHEDYIIRRGNYKSLLKKVMR